MDKITVSAPGKLMLLGEHAVVYGHPCLVTAVEQRLKVTVEKSNTNGLTLNAPDVSVNDYYKPIAQLGNGEIPKGAKFVEIAVLNFFQKHKFSDGLKITTNSEFSSQFGFGSSSASTVCVVKALFELFEIKTTPKEIFDLSYKTVLDIQKTGSGFDVAAAVYGGVLYFITGGKVIEPIIAGDLPLLVAYSGVKADTVSMINLVKEKMQTHKEGVEEIFKNIANLVEEGKIALMEKDWQRLGTLMNFNQNYLEDLGVSTEKLDDMVLAARKAGAFGAKLSGAGGGDCMIAVVPEEKRKNIEEAIKSVGGEILDVKVSNEGVKIEI